jgi:hypothetical protein
MDEAICPEAHPRMDVLLSHNRSCLCSES